MYKWSSSAASPSSSANTFQYTGKTLFCTTMSTTKLISFEVTNKTTEEFSFTYDPSTSAFTPTISGMNPKSSVDTRPTIEVSDDKTVIDALTSYIKEAGATADIDELSEILRQCNANQLSEIETASAGIVPDLSSATDGLWNHLYIQRFGFQSAYLLVKKMQREKSISINYWRQFYHESAETEEKRKPEVIEKPTTSSSPFNKMKKLCKKPVDLFKKPSRVKENQAKGGGGEEETPLHPATLLGHLSLATGFSSHGYDTCKFIEDHSEFVYSPVEVKQHVIKLHPMVKWEDPPKYLWCKLQVDGAVTEVPQAGAGGVLARADGRCIAAFSYHLEEVSLTYAKLWALWHGLVLAEMMGIEYLIVETDSMFVAETLNWKRNPVDEFHSNFQKMINDYRNILPDNCILQMITAESNAAAHIFAERGADY